MVGVANRPNFILPTEILGLVFRECVLGEPIYLPICHSCSTVTTPWSLGQVNSSWKKISESDPKLWSSITLSYEFVRDKETFTRRVQEVIIPRTKHEPISLTCLGSDHTNSINTPDPDGVISILVMPNLARFRNLSLSLGSTALGPLITSPPGFFKSLESVKLEYLQFRGGGPHNTVFEARSISAFDHAPNLHKVQLYCRPYYRFIGDNPVCLPWGQLKELSIRGGLPYPAVVRFLPSCAQLVHCNIFIEGEGVPCSYIVLPCLRSISLDFNSSDTASSFLKILILPVLTSLRLCIDSFELLSLQEILLALLARSRCRLEFFELGYPFRNPINNIGVLLEQMPDLRKLYLPILAPLPVPVIKRMIDGELVRRLEGVHCSIQSLPLMLELLNVRRLGSSSGDQGSYRGIKCALIWGLDIQLKCECDNE